MPHLDIVTINILSDLSRWRQRRSLLLEGLQTLNADVIAMQEVHLKEKTAEWLAKEAGYAHLFITPKTTPRKAQEGIALLSRLPFQTTYKLDLGSQGRVAQAVGLKLHGSEFIIANGHYFWQPGESAERVHQVEKMLIWLNELAGDSFRITCGDFNATPDTQAIELISRQYHSAHQIMHGAEPAKTVPTPLPRSRLAIFFTLLWFGRYLRWQDFSLNWSGTLDYIFVDPRLKVIECQVVLNHPHPDKRRIYPSDHYGIYTRIEY